MLFSGRNSMEHGGSKVTTSFGKYVENCLPTLSLEPGGGHRVLDLCSTHGLLLIYPAPLSANSVRVLDKSEFVSVLCDHG
jgi:hypothetical protein